MISGSHVDDVAATLVDDLNVAVLPIFGPSTARSDEHPVQRFYRTRHLPIIIIIIIIITIIITIITIIVIIIIRCSASTARALGAKTEKGRTHLGSPTHTRAPSRLHRAPALLPTHFHAPERL